MNILGADAAAEAICRNPIVLRAFSDTIKSTGEALTAHLGKEDMLRLRSVSNNPILLKITGNKIHQTAAAIKGLLGDSEGRYLLKEKPRLLQSTPTNIEGNIQTLCDEFDQELVLEALRVRPSLLYDRPTANNTVKCGDLK